jgi:hypothetical protein
VNASGGEEKHRIGQPERPEGEEDSQIASPVIVDGCSRVGHVRVQHHWWNGGVRLARRDVYVRTDGEAWEVEAQMGGPEGKSKVQQCPGQASAMILADAWRGPRWQWRKI